MSALPGVVESETPFHFGEAVGAQTEQLGKGALSSTTAGGPVIIASGSSDKRTSGAIVLATANSSHHDPTAGSGRIGLLTGNTTAGTSMASRSQSTVPAASTQGSMSSRWLRAPCTMFLR